jgi:excisionase family DNA binding protein
MSRNDRKRGAMELERRHSLKEAQEILGLSERTVHRWIKSGKLKSYKPGRDHQIPESAIRKVIEESEVYPKVQASLWPEERPERRFAWMAGVLERVLDTWERQVREKKNHYQSRTIAVAALDVQDTVTFNYKPEWDALPSEEKTQRHALAKRIDQLVLDAFDHYKQAKKAETEEVEAIQRRREEIRRRTREISA